MQKRIEVGLVGFGMAGRYFHAPLISCERNLHLKTVVERHSQRAKDIYPGVETAAGLEELLADPAIEMVVIAAPNPLHYDFARRSLLAGKHVVVDKPFTVTSAEADELIQTARRQKKVLSVFQNRRFDGDFRTVRQVVANGILGRVVSFEAHYDRFISALRPDTWKEKADRGSGILFDIGSHLIDQVLLLFGLPRTVTCHLAIQRDGGEIDDAMDVTLRYPRLKVALKASMLARERGPRFVVHGTAGSYVKYGLDVQEECLKQGRRPDSENWGVEPGDAWGVLNTEVNGLHYVGKVETLPGCYQSYYRNIHGAVAEGLELEVKPEEARDVIRVIECAVESNRKNTAIELC